IGVAMGDGTDIAIDVADVVVMKNDLSKLGYAHRVSKRLNKIVQQNIIFSMLVVATLIILNFLGIANIAFSVLIHEGSTLVVIFNGLRLLVNTK
ncbi:heavy metal translocating P-type ATPase, partial [Enterococcus faecalis]|nr:heavy metal translocating P-type ATPase [Enterococcus faecalis]